MSDTRLVRPRLWTAAGSALLIAGAAACTDQGGAAPAQPTAPPASAAGEGEGEGGEAGAADAYGAAPAESLTALRLHHLKGFFLVAQAAAPVEGEESAAALAGQGMLEVYDPAKAVYDAAGVNEAVLRRAAESGSAGALNAAIVELDRAARQAGGNAGDVVTALLNISTGLYSLVVTEDGVDPIEWQHSYGAALAAQQVAARDGALRPARQEIDAFVANWTSVTAPADPAEATSPGALQAQASRIELTLSGV
ncbi:MAG: hypothetical protein ACK4Y4_07460 [Brevundimonas sp.]